MQYRPKFLKRCFQRLRRTFFCSVTRNSSWDSGSSRIFSTSLPRRSSGRQDLAVRSRPANRCRLQAAPQREWERVTYSGGSQATRK